MEKKIIMITGATDGIGREAALQLTPEKSLLVLVGRNSEAEDPEVRKKLWETSCRLTECYALP